MQEQGAGGVFDASVEHQVQSLNLKASQIFHITATAEAVSNSPLLQSVTLQ